MKHNLEIDLENLNTQIRAEQVRDQSDGVARHFCIFESDSSIFSSEPNEC